MSLGIHCVRVCVCVWLFQGRHVVSDVGRHHGSQEAAEHRQRGHSALNNWWLFACAIYGRTELVTGWSCDKVLLQLWTHDFARIFCKAGYKGVNCVFYVYVTTNLFFVAVCLLRLWWYFFFICSGPRLTTLSMSISFPKNKYFLIHCSSYSCVSKFMCSLLICMFSFYWNYMCLSELDLAGPQSTKLTDAEIGIYYKLPPAVITFCTLFCFLYIFYL